MLILFLVAEGVQLDVGQDLLPTSRVSSLYSVTERACGEKVVLLSSSGHLLDQQDILASYDVGTEEKPVFVFLKTPRPWKSPPNLLGTVSSSLEQQVAMITPTPSPSSLQRQIALAEGFVKESSRLSRGSQLLTQLLLLQRAGWQAAQGNSSAIVKSFQRHFKAFTKLVQSQSKAQPCYQELLDRFPQKLELLKRITVPTSLNQSVFSQQLCSLYDWVSSQDDHSSLPELHKECHEALAQADVSALDKLLEEGKLLSKSAQNVLMETELEDKAFASRALAEKAASLAKDQKSMADSLHSTVQRVLGSGDAGMLANISLSNVKLLQMMAGNSQDMASCIRQLELYRETQSKAVASGLLALTSIQRQLSETDSSLLYYSELLQLTRRRFEILEQICAAPDVLTAMLKEINTRKVFKKQFLKEAQNAAQRFRWQRETEKARRQAFLEKYGQHFVLSLFPPLLDKPPHILASVPEHFDDDICALPSEDLKRMGQNLPNQVSSPVELQCTQREQHTQTDGSSDMWEERVTGLTERVKELERELLAARDQQQQLLARCQSPETNHVAVQVHLRYPATEFGVQVATDTPTEVGTNTMRDSPNRETQTDIVQLHNYCSQTDRTELGDRNQKTQTDRTELGDRNQKTQTDGMELGDRNQKTQTEQLLTNDGWVQTATKQDEKHSRLVQTLVVEVEEEGSQTSTAPVEDLAVQTKPADMCLAVTQTEPVLVHELSEEEAQLAITKDAIAVLQHQLLALEEERRDLQQHVDQLQGQLELEQDTRLKQTMELEREMKELQRSLEGNIPGAAAADVPVVVVSISNLKVGDITLFLQDQYQNFLALTVDQRIHYLNHTSAQAFTTDLSDRVHIPLRRKILLGRVTQKVLVEVKKESNRLNVPIGQRLYKITAEEVHLTANS